MVPHVSVPVSDQSQVGEARRVAMRMAAEAGLTVDIGCQVGESSLLSAAQLILIAAAPRARHFEGCYGEHLLRFDPVQPCLQIGYGGRPPKLPQRAGLGVRVDEALLHKAVCTRINVGQIRTAERKDEIWHSLHA